MLFVGWCAINVISLIPLDIPILLANVLWYGILSSLVITQIYRYWKVSNLIQRQQTKWIVYGLTIVFLFEACSTLYLAFFPYANQGGSLIQLLLTIINTLVLLFLPLSFGLAILRYRLWDIDILINRTLVYSALTATLGLLYVGLIIALQSLLRTLTEQISNFPPAIVASTLVIAALFQPLRSRIQTSIDRRFYRRKYDAIQALTTFSTSLRGEADLNQLSDQLIKITQDTMQPTHVSLWLRRLPASEKPHHLTEAQQKNPPPEQGDEYSFDPM